MSQRGQHIGGPDATSYVGGCTQPPKFDAPKAEQSTSEATLNRLKSAIEFGHALLERLESLESRVNGARPQAVQKDATGVYTQSLSGEMQRTADAAEYLTNRLEETISSLERFA